MRLPSCIEETLYYVSNIDQNTMQYHSFAYFDNIYLTELSLSYLPSLHDYRSVFFLVQENLRDRVWWRCDQRG